ncbi:hypothetical protein GGD83_000452 [Rhodoblastus sphagnicola]|nr:hypothetical protein [Rhodoblastus sphagnicola]
MARDRWRARLEDGLKLDLNKLICDGMVKPGCDLWASIRWSYTNSGGVVAAGAIRSSFHGETGLLDLELGGVRQTFALASRPRHFGGRQWYFVCPSTARMVSVLWRPYGATAFASRQAWGRRVAYGSQFETPHDRALSRAQSLRRRLGGEVSLISEAPPRPKGMHTRTYRKKLEEIYRDELICDQYLAGALARFTR